MSSTQYVERGAGDLRAVYLKRERGVGTRSFSDVEPAPLCSVLVSLNGCFSTTLQRLYMSLTPFVRSLRRLLPAMQAKGK